MASVTKIFAWNRWSESATTISAFNAVSTFPASNTKLQQRSRVYRSSSLTGIPFLAADFGQGRKISGVAFTSHNMSKDAIWHLMISNNANFSSPVLSKTGLRVWESTFGNLTEFADGSTGRPTASTIKLLEFCSENPRVVRWETFTEVTGRYLRFQFDDPTNADGWIEVAWCYAGQVVSLDRNQLYGWEIQPDDVVRQHRSATGQIWTDVLHRKIRAKADFAFQSETFAYGFWQFLFNKLGKTGEMVVALKDDDLTDKFWFSIYCRLVSVPEQTHVGFQTYSFPLELEELTG